MLYVTCAICGKSVAPKERRFVDKKRETKAQSVILTGQGSRVNGTPPAVSRVDHLSCKGVAPSIQSDGGIAA